MVAFPLVLGEPYRYSASVMSRLILCFLITLLLGCQRHHTGNITDALDERQTNERQNASPIDRAIAEQELIADSLAVGDPASDAVKLAEKHLGSPYRLAISHTVDGRTVIREPVTSHWLPVENCALIAYQTNGRIDRLEIATRIPQSEQLSPKHDHNIDSVVSYKLRGIKIGVTIRIGDSIEDARKIIEQNRISNQTIGENRFRIKGDTVEFSVEDSIITGISKNSETQESIALEFITSIPNAENAE